MLWSALGYPEFRIPALRTFDEATTSTKAPPRQVRAFEACNQSRTQVSQKKANLGHPAKKLVDCDRAKTQVSQRKADLACKLPPEQYNFTVQSWKRRFLLKAPCCSRLFVGFDQEGNYS
jgi:hypothetical protein